MDYERLVRKLRGSESIADLQNSINIEEIILDALGIGRETVIYPKTIEEARWVLTRLLMNNQAVGLSKVLNFVTNTIYRLTKVGGNKTTDEQMKIAPALLYASAARLIFRFVEEATRVNYSLEIMEETDLQDAIQIVGGKVNLQGHPLSRLINSSPEAIGPVLGMIKLKLASEEGFIVKLLPFLLHLATAWEPVTTAVGIEFLDVLIDENMKKRPICSAMLACFVKRQITSKNPTIESFYQLMRVTCAVNYYENYMEDLLYNILDATCSFWAAGFPVSCIIDHLAGLLPKISSQFFAFSLACMTAGDANRVVPLSWPLVSNLIPALGARWRTAWTKLAVSQQIIGVFGDMQNRIKSLLETSTDFQDEILEDFEFESGHLRAWFAYYQRLTTSLDESLIFDIESQCPSILFPAHILNMISQLFSAKIVSSAKSIIEQLLLIAQKDPSFHEPVMYGILFSFQNDNLSESKIVELLQGLVSLSCLPNGTPCVRVIAIVSQLLHSSPEYRKLLLPLISAHILRGNRRAALFNMLQTHLPVLLMDQDSSGSLLAYAQSLYYLAQVVEKEAYLHYALSMCTQFLKRPMKEMTTANEETVARSLIVDSLGLLCQALVIDPVAVWKGLQFSDILLQNHPTILHERILCFAGILFRQSCKVSLDEESSEIPPPPAATLEALGTVYKMMMESNKPSIVDAAAEALKDVPITIIQSVQPIDLAQVLSHWLSLGDALNDSGIVSLAAYLLDAEIEAMSRSVLIGSASEKKVNLSVSSTSQKANERMMAILSSAISKQTPSFFGIHCNNASFS